MNAQKKALITGVTGQDGSFLAAGLTALGYEVKGLSRANTDYSKSSIHALIQNFKPNEIYHFAAQPYVGKSWNLIDETLHGTALLTANLLEAASKLGDVKFFNASSSEIYAESETALSENDTKHPTNPYGCAKLFSYHLVQSYRENYNLFATNGILFNHESERRHLDFFSQKLIHGALDIYSKKNDVLKLGNLNIIRDWGSAEEYMQVVPKIMQLDTPVDVNVCSGRGISAWDVVAYVFSLVNLDPKKHVIIDDSFVRNKEKKTIIGSNEKLFKLLGWKPSLSIEEVLKKMLIHEARSRGIHEIS